MREKTQRFIVTFPTTTDSIQMETACKEEGVPGRLIPVPTVISAGCGMCWSAPAADREQVEQVLGCRKLRYEEVYELLL